jgi:hypothetical protein
VQEPVPISKEVMCQEFAFSWYTTLFFRLLEAVSGTDVPKISQNLSHHLCPRPMCDFSGGAGSHMYGG